MNISFNIVGGEPVASLTQRHLVLVTRTNALSSGEGRVCSENLNTCRVNSV